MTDPQAVAVRVSDRAGPLFGVPRFAGYLAQCAGDQLDALDLYQWNVEVSAAMWETIGHVEVVLRNRMAGRLEARHRRLGRSGSWLDDHGRDLDDRARDDIGSARRRIYRKRKPISDGQLIAELGFGFWRFLLARRYTATLWPDLASGFPHAPDRRRGSVEAPVVRLHEFRNRLAHQERIWNLPIRSVHRDALAVARFMDRDLACWVRQQSRVNRMLTNCPQRRPYP